jgi:kinesin family protein 18/19
VRPILKAEQARNNKRDIIRVIDDKVVVVLDPDEAKDYLDQVQNRTKEKRYTFDAAYGTEVRATHHTRKCLPQCRCLLIV